jgi:hypothetical protein
MRLLAVQMMNPPAEIGPPELILHFQWYGPV